MSFLAPWALLLAAAAGVPLLLHLLRRRTGNRVDFPALRYLLRAEREHAREVRLRNIALMLLRVGVVLAIALAVAKPIGVLPGVGHPPTAVAMVIDNSMSSGAAGSEGPVLTRLIEAATATIDQSATGDELTFVTMDGEITSGDAEALRTSLAQLRPIGGAGDIARAVARARAVLEASSLPERRLVILTDAQASAWSTALEADAETPTLVFRPEGEAPRNRGVAAVTVEPPVWSPRGSVRATLVGDSASWRLAIGGSSLARGTANADAPIIARAQPGGRGWLAGAIELEPDEMRGDDVRHFAVYVGEAPAVRRDASAGAFVMQAVAALSESGRVRDGNDVLVASATAARRPGLFFAPDDELDISAANRALERASIPWRFAARRTGPVQARGAGVAGVTVKEWFDLVRANGSTDRADTIATLGASPWIVAGEGYVLVGSAAVPDATDLPLRANFVTWLDGLIAERLATSGGRALDVAPGVSVVVPAGITALELADSTLRPVTSGATLTAPYQPGVYFWRRGDRRAGALVVNPEPSESSLNYLSADSLRALAGATSVESAAPALARAVFAAGGRRALDTPLLILALILLLAESLVARRGRPSVSKV